jgi:hypothetical protein
MRTRKFPWYVYFIILLLYVMPIFITRAFPSYASLISATGAIVLLPIFSVYLIVQPLPLIDHFRGVRLMPFDTKPVKMTFYAILRVLICLAGFYVFVSLAIPAWRGAYDLYVAKDNPDVLNVVVQDQGLGLSFPPIAAAINTVDLKNYTWFYGRTLYLGDTQNYTITLLPHTNIVINVSANQSTAAAHQ